LVTICPDNDGIVVPEVIEEGEVESDLVSLVVVPDLLSFVAVGYGYQKLCRRREQLARAVENA
jgi:hypothetical protein